jgi:Tim44-like domain
MPRWPLTLAALAVSLLASPAAAFGLAGGATGGGGGGGYSGGGGSGGSGGSSCSGSECAIGFGIVALLILGFFVATWLGALYIRARRRAREARAEAHARQADAGDGYWDPQKLEERVRECFFPIQSSWEDRDVAVSRRYVSDPLYERHRLQLDGLEQQNRRNRIQDLELKDIRLVRVHNIGVDAEDRFVAHIACSARDWVEDTNTGELVNGSRDVTQFEQYWSFSRHPEHGWVLDEIQQAEEGRYHETAAFVNADEGPLAGPVLDRDPYRRGPAAPEPG